MKRTLKHRILELFSDRQWHRGMQVLIDLGIAWSWLQRKNELQREEGIMFESRMFSGPNDWEYRLLTDPNDIDFENCCLKKKQLALTF